MPSGAGAAPVSEWAPRTRPASGCVCTILTKNLMGAHSWGAAAVEIARNWAVAHGYRYVRFSETSHYNTSARVPRFVELAADDNKAVQFWFKPQAMLSLLERGEEACPWCAHQLPCPVAPSLLPPDSRAHIVASRFHRASHLSRQGLLPGR